VAEDRPVHVRDASTDVRFADTAFVDGRLGRVRMYASVPVHDHEGYAVGALCVVDPRARRLAAPQLDALQDLATQAEHLLEMRRQHLRLLDVLAEVDHYASHDPLTGLVNRRVLVDRLDLALQRSARTGVPPTLLFCDVDGFKAVNDRLGHQAGDRALVDIARHLRTVVRGHDTVARLGGDEFVILCEDVSAEGALAVVDRLRAPVPANHGLSLSVGLSTPQLPCTAAEALDHADTLMYADKVTRRVA
jgi:diguanylate cyclase (GGDEF)-like protein